MELRKTLLIGLLFTSVSCAYDNAEELYGVKDCPPEGTSFSKTISPLISTNCAISSCHVNGQQLPILENYAQISANASKIKVKTSNGTMPPLTSGKNLTQQEIDDIACWVDAGAIDN